MNLILGVLFAAIVTLAASGQLDTIWQPGPPTSTATMGSIAASDMDDVDEITVQVKDLTGRASVVDGDTIEIQGQRVRLYGIDAPESDQLCRDAGGSRHRCGQKAAWYLADLIGGATVTCHLTNTRTYEREIGRCYRTSKGAGADLSKLMVASGHARAYSRYATDYVNDERQAIAMRAGFWAGVFDNPEEYRRCKAQRGASACQP